jgi:mortality factor 4-like protein 1
LKLNVPEILKVLLVDDWEAVTKNNQVRALVEVENCERLTVARQLVTLPRSPTVAEILHDFEEFVLSQENPECVNNERLLMDSNHFQVAGPFCAPSDRH